MSEVNHALQRIARGTGIVFVGTVISMLFGFLSRALIARYFSVGEYGVYNLAWTVMSITLVVATLGFQNSLPREVAYYREKEPSRVRNLISTALTIALLNSLIWVTIIFLNAESISQIFKDERLVHALKIMVIALPFWALITVITSISRGLGRVREQVYFQNIVYPAAFVAFTIVVTILRLQFEYIFLVYVISQIVTFTLLILDIHRTRLFRVSFSLNFVEVRRLISFSLPLMMTGILGFTMTWADTLMLGYFKSSEMVGIYNAAAPIAKLLPVFLTSAAIMYSPIATSLFAQGKIREMGRVYQILTKWIFLLTLPIFSAMFLFPEATIKFFFGEKYVSASVALQILALGFMFHTFLGLNGLSLVVIGKPKLNMVGDLFAVIGNIALNILLIPAYGIIGAAVATSFSYFAANVFRSLWLYQNVKIHPFSRNYMKILVTGFVLLMVVHNFHLNVENVFYAIPVLAIFLAIYFFLILLSKSVDKEDIELILAIEKRLGVDFGILKKVLRRFV